MRSDAELIAGYPWIKWTTPVPIHRLGIVRMGCRICIARYGLRISDLHRRAFLHPADYHRHMATVHPSVG